jgi:hypothetical protein
VAEGSSMTKSAGGGDQKASREEAREREDTQPRKTTVHVVVYGSVRARSGSCEEGVKRW